MSKDCRKEKATCKYCAREDGHKDDECSLKYNFDAHRCCSCNGRIGHHAGDKNKCLTYLTHFISACEKENVDVDAKTIKLHQDLKQKYVFEDALKIKNNANAQNIQTQSIEDKLNNRIAKSLVINKAIAAQDFDEDVDE